MARDIILTSDARFFMGWKRTAEQEDKQQQVCDNIHSVKDMNKIPQSKGERMDPWFLVAVKEKLQAVSTLEVRILHPRYVELEASGGPVFTIIPEIRIDSGYNLLNPDEGTELSTGISNESGHEKFDLVAGDKIEKNALKQHYGTKTNLSISEITSEIVGYMVNYERFSHFRP